MAWANKTGDSGDVSTFVISTTTQHHIALALAPPWQHSRINTPLRLIPPHPARTSSSPRCTMPTALSPYRYIQLARYVLQRWLDLSSSPSAWKGKARALPNARPPIAARRALLVGAGAGQGVLRSSVVEESAAQQPQPKSSSSAPSTNSTTTGPKPPHGGRPHVWDPPSAGPSRAPANEPNYPLGPDPSLPPEPREIYRLMNDQKLFVKGAIKPPREVVVLCHGGSASTLPF